MPATPNDLWDAMVNVESKGDPNAVGKAGEIGLVQIKPSTAADYGVPADALYHPEVQRMLFNRIMGKYLTRYGDTRKAVAAWNAGQGAVDRGATDPGYVAKVAEALGSAASTVFGEGTAEAGEFPTAGAGLGEHVVPWKGGETPFGTTAKARLGRPGGGMEKTEAGVLRAMREPRSLYEETARPEYEPSPPLPTGPYATYAHPMGARITKDAPLPRKSWSQTAQQLIQSGRRATAHLSRDFLRGSDLTNPSVFGPWVDRMTDALAQLPPGRFGAPQNTINLPLIRKRSEDRWEVPYGDPRSPMWKPAKGEPPMESALKSSFEEALPFLVVAGAPLAIAVTAEGLGAMSAVGATGVATEYLWNGVGIPAVTAALGPLIDKVTDHLANGIERTGAVNPAMAFPLADSLMNVFRMFPQLALFPRDAANLARAMTQRELLPELADMGEWLTSKTRGPWVGAVARFLERQGISAKYLPFTLAQALEHEREDQTREVLERARTQEMESARREAALYKQLEEQAEQAEPPAAEPEPFMGTPYGEPQ